MKQTKFFISLSEMVGESWAETLVLRMNGQREVEDKEKAIAALKVNQFLASVETGALDSRVCDAVSYYLTQTETKRRHVMIEKILGIHFPSHSSLSDEKKALENWRTKNAEHIAHVNKMKASAEIAFTNILAKYESAFKVVNQSTELLAEMNAAKIAKSSNMYKIASLQSTNADKELANVMKDMQALSADYTRCELAELIPTKVTELISTYFGTGDKEKKEEKTA